METINTKSDYEIIEDELNEFDNNYWVMLFRGLEDEINLGTELKNETLEFFNELIKIAKPTENNEFNIDFKNTDEFIKIYDEMLDYILNNSLLNMSKENGTEVKKTIYSKLHKLSEKISNTEIDILHTVSAEKDKVKEIL